MPTFIIPIEGRPNHYVVGLDRRVVEIEWSGDDDTAKEVKTVVEVDAHDPQNRFNDAKADPRGRLFAGKSVIYINNNLFRSFIHFVRNNYKSWEDNFKSCDIPQSTLYTLYIFPYTIVQWE